MAKIVVLGANQAGKSALVRKITKKNFIEQEETTHGAKFHQLTLSPKSADSAGLTSELWDVGGQQRYQPLVNGYCKDAQVIWLCCDLTAQNFEGTLNEWLTILKNQGDDKLPIILVGTKNDKVDEKNLKEKESLLQQKARGLNYSFVLTSAKTDTLRDDFSCSDDEERTDLNGLEQLLQQTYNHLKNKQLLAPEIVPPLKLKDEFLTKAKAITQDFLAKHKGRIALGLLVALVIILALTVPGFGLGVGLAGALGLSVLSAQMIFALGGGIVALASPFWLGSLLKESAALGFALLLAPTIKLVSYCFYGTADLAARDKTINPYTMGFGIIVLGLLVLPVVAAGLAFRLGVVLNGSNTTQIGSWLARDGAEPLPQQNESEQSIISDSSNDLSDSVASEPERTVTAYQAMLAKLGITRVVTDQTEDQSVMLNDKTHSLVFDPVVFYEAWSPPSNPGNSPRLV